MKDIIKKASHIAIYKENTEIKINNIKDKLVELLDGSYSTPSYISTDDEDIITNRKKGLWIEITFDQITYFNDYPFEKLLFSLKPKYNFINLARSIDGKYDGRSLSFNIATKTTNLYKEILNQIKE